MTPLRRALDGVRVAAALAPARPAYAAGIRAAIATVVPLLLDQVAGTGGGTWMSLAGFSGALVDKGGPYRTRAATMGALTLAAAAAAALGTLAGGRHAAAVPVALAVAVGCSLARVWGNAGASVGGSALTVFVIALAYPPATPAEALSRAGYSVVGGLWTMLVALVLWPLRPYRPVRLAVAGCFDALAEYAEGQAQGPAVRAALETARAALAGLRRGRPGQSGRGEHLLVLHEVADQLFGQLLALRDTVETIPPGARDPTAERKLKEALPAFAATARALSAGILDERGAATVPVAWDGDALAWRPDAANGSEAHYAQAAVLLDRLAQYARVGAETVATLNGGGPPPRQRGPLDPDPGELGSWPLASAFALAFAPLRAALSGDSVVLRYALRVGLVTAVAVGLTAALGLKRGYWVTLTAVVILQPYTGATTLRATQRVLGTVLGGILTAVLGALFHDPAAILPLAFVFTACCVALLPLSYAAFSVFLTPTFVLLAEASTGDWHLAGVRIVNTLLGGGLALAGARLLWPTPEWSRLPGYMAAALRANRNYLHTAGELFDDRSEAAGRRLRAARREVGLAAINADESFQRALGEHRGRAEDLTPLMTFLTYTRRLAASTAALAATRHAGGSESAATLAPFVREAGAILEDLSLAVLNGRAPNPLPPLDEPAETGRSPRLRPRLEQVARQLKSLHDAIARWQVARASWRRPHAAAATGRL